MSQYLDFADLDTWVALRTENWIVVIVVCSLLFSFGAPFPLSLCKVFYNLLVLLPHLDICAIQSIWTKCSKKRTFLGWNVWDLFRSVKVMGGEAQKDKEKKGLNLCSMSDKAASHGWKLAWPSPTWCLSDSFFPRWLSEDSLFLWKEKSKNKKRGEKSVP